MRQSPPLGELTDLGELQAIQDDFAEAAGISSVVVSLDGTPLTAFSNPTAFCRLIQSTEKGKRRCLESFATMGRAALASNEGGIHYCFAQCGHYVAPIVIDGEHRATMCAGQFIPEPFSSKQLKSLERTATEIDLPPEMLVEAAKNMRVVEPDAVRQSSRLLFSITSVIARLAAQATKLRRFQASLQEAHDKLEQQAEERTRVLSKSNEQLRQEIAERKAAEEKLRLTQFAVEQSSDAVFWMGANARFTYANDAATRLLGYSRDELLTMTVHDINPAHHPEAWAEHWREIEKRGSFTFETRLGRKDGEAVPVEITVSLATFDDKRINCAFVRDVTERKRAEEELQEEKSRLRTIVDAMDGMDAALTIQDREYNIIYQNGIMEHMTGGCKGKCYKLYEGRDQVCDDCPVERAFRDGRSHNSERVILEGTEINYYDNTAHPVRNAAGEITSCVEVVRNVTERKLAEMARELMFTRQQKLNDLQRALLGPGDIGEKLNRISDAVVDAFDAELCRIWITRPGDRCESGCAHDNATEGPQVCQHRDRCLWLMASSGQHANIDVDVHERVAFGCGKIGGVAAAEESKFLTNEAASDPRIDNHEWVKELGLVSFAGYQLRPPGGETIGVLALFSKRAISDDEDALLESLGSTAAQVIQKARVDEEAILQNRFLKSVLESLTHPFYVLDAANYSIVMANNAARRSGPPEAETCHAMTHLRETPCDGKDHICPLAEITKTGKPTMVEHTHYDTEGNPRAVEVHSYPIFDENGRVVQAIEYSHDVTERRAEQARLDALQKQLQAASHRAGMAEVATGVLHNVGNVLNSVNVSASIVEEKMRKSEAQDLAKVVQLINEHAEDLGSFVTEDQRGKHLPRFLAALAESLAGEQAIVLEELQSLTKNIDHIKTIVSTQQSYASAVGLVESISLTDLIEDALRLNEATFQRHSVHVERDCAELPPIEGEKQKLLQILINLIRNAKHALVEAGGESRRLILRTSANGKGRVRIEVTDNGVGIAAENLTRIFAHGFTTKQARGGRGFGLHHSALAAKEMGGALTVHSDGPGTGATFTLELPLQQAKASQGVTAVTTEKDA